MGHSILYHQWRLTRCWGDNQRLRRCLINAIGHSLLPYQEAGSRGVVTAATAWRVVVLFDADRILHRTGGRHRLDQKREIALGDGGGIRGGAVVFEHAMHVVRDHRAIVFQLTMDVACDGRGRVVLAC